MFLLFPAVSSADLYKYADEKGTAHLTDDLSKVPAKFKNKVTVIKEEPQPAAEAAKSIEEKPSITERIAEKKEEAVYKLNEASDNFDNSLDDIKTWVIIGGVSAILAIIISFVVIRSAKLRCIVGSMVLSSIVLVVFALYMQRVMDKKGDIKEEINKIKSLAEERQKAVNEATEQ